MPASDDAKALVNRIHELKITGDSVYEAQKDLRAFIKNDKSGSLWNLLGRAQNTSEFDTYKSAILFGQDVEDRFDDLPGMTLSDLFQSGVLPCLNKASPRDRQDKLIIFSIECSIKAFKDKIAYNSILALRCKTMCSLLTKFILPEFDQAGHGVGETLFFSTAILEKVVTFYYEIYTSNSSKINKYLGQELQIEKKFEALILCQQAPASNRLAAFTLSSKLLLHPSLSLSVDLETLEKLAREIILELDPNANDSNALYQLLKQSVKQKIERKSAVDANQYSLIIEHCFKILRTELLSSGNSSFSQGPLGFLGALAPFDVANQVRNVCVHVIRSRLESENRHGPAFESMALVVMELFFLSSRFQYFEKDLTIRELQYFSENVKKLQKYLKLDIVASSANSHVKNLQEIYRGFDLTDSFSGILTIKIEEYAKLLFNALLELTVLNGLMDKQVCDVLGLLLQHRSSIFKIKATVMIARNLKYSSGSLLDNDLLTLFKPLVELIGDDDPLLLEKAWHALSALLTSDVKRDHPPSYADHRYLTTIYGFADSIFADYLNGDKQSLSLVNDVCGIIAEFAQYQNQLDLIKEAEVLQKLKNVAVVRGNLSSSAIEALNNSADCGLIEFWVNNVSYLIDEIAILSVILAVNNDARGKNAAYFSSNHKFFTYYFKLLARCLEYGDEFVSVWINLESEQSCELISQILQVRKDIENDLDIVSPAINALAFFTYDLAEVFQDLLNEAKLTQIASLMEEMTNTYSEDRSKVTLGSLMAVLANFTRELTLVTTRRLINLFLEPSVKLLGFDSFVIVHSKTLKFLNDVTLKRFSGFNISWLIVSLIQEHFGDNAKIFNKFLFDKNDNYGELIVITCKALYSLIQTDPKVKKIVAVNFGIKELLSKILDSSRDTHAVQLTKAVASFDEKKLH